MICKNVLSDKDIIIENIEGIRGMQRVLPDGVEISVSSDDPNASYIACGENLASDDHNDYGVGSVTYSVGSGFTTNRQIYPNAMLYFNPTEDMLLKISAVVKNTGGTDGTSFRPYIAIVDPETGKLANSTSGESGQATSEGIEITHIRLIPKGMIAFWYIHTYSVVAGSVSKIEQLMASLTPYDKAVPSYKAYEANKRSGDGTLLSIVGQNHIMSSSELFDLSYTCDFLEHKWR